MVLCGLAADGRIGARAQPPGQVAPDIELDVRVGHEQRLGVGVHGDELDATQVGLDHAVDGVDATAADPDDLDLCLVVLCVVHSHALDHWRPLREFRHEPLSRAPSNLNLKLRSILMSFLE